MIRRKGYIFTTKHHSKRGIMSTVFGVLSIITLGSCVYLSYLNKGEINTRHAAAAVLAVIYMIIGIILGAWSTIEREKFKMFTVLGIVTNAVAFGILSIILYAGAYID